MRLTIADHVEATWNHAQLLQCTYFNGYNIHCVIQKQNLLMNKFSNVCNINRTWFTFLSHNEQWLTFFLYRQLFCVHDKCVKIKVIAEC